MVFSETELDDGSDMAARGLTGLKSPGEDTGVLLAVREGACRVFIWDGVVVQLVPGSGCGCCESIAASWRWRARVVVKREREAVAAKRHDELGRKARLRPPKLQSGHGGGEKRNKREDEGSVSRLTSRPVRMHGKRGRVL